METTQKLSRREKLSLIGKYLRPCWGHFAAALLCACLAMVFNALTPQIIRITVDSILGTEPVRLPAFLMRWLSWPVLEARPLTALWWAAGGVLLTALLGRLQLRPAAPAGPGLRELCQGHPGRPVPPHPVSALCLAQK